MEYDNNGFELNEELEKDKGGAKKEVRRAEKEHRRAEKYKAQAAAKREKERLKAERLENRASVKEERKKLREERRKEPHGKSGYVAGIITLGLSTLILASVLAFTSVTPSAEEAALETGYRKSFYDTVAQVDNMDINLSKAIATKDSGAVQLYLVDLAVNSELAENDIQQLPLKDESKFYTTKIINQVGDFAKYLNKKIVRGEKPSAEDYKSLRALYKANAALKETLQSVMANMQDGYSFSEMGEKLQDNDLLDRFNRLQELSVEYPELIYDGPFSDGRDNAEMKGLSDEEITREEAAERFKKYFKDYDVADITAEEKTAGITEVYGVQGALKGETLYAQITVKGGNLLLFSFAGSCKDVVLEEEFAVENAKNFLENAGYNGMKAVWINLANNVYTINFAPEKDGVIMYPDLVKARVCAETGMVIGVEAASYLANHTERQIASPAVTKSEARAKVSDEIAVETGRLAVIPFGNSAERLCYEFFGTLDGDEYYIYVDALTGAQAEMFKVINSEDGRLLM